MGRPPASPAKLEYIKSWKRRNRDKVNASQQRYRATLEVAGRKKRVRTEDHRRHHLKSRYGLTQEQYIVLEAAQGGKCAMCRGDQKEGHRFHIDHDHATGAVRGLLCTRCNMALGVYEQPGFVESADAYLARHAQAMKVAL
jgi:hypothetical protein